MAVDPWAEQGSQPGGAGGYLSDADFRRTMDQTFGPGKWRETGGFRSQQREAALRAQGALTVAPGHTSAHSVGESDAPGAHDIVADGLTPAQTAERIKAVAPDLFAQVYPEAAHGSQGAHLHLGVAQGTQGGDPWAENSADPWAPAKAAAPAPNSKQSFLQKFNDDQLRQAGSFIGGVVSGAGKLVENAGRLADVAARGFNTEAETLHALATGQPTDQANKAIAAAAADRTPVVSRVTTPIGKSIQAQGDQVAPANRSGLESFMHGAGEMAPALAGAVVDPALGAVSFGAQGFGEAQDEAAQAGASPAVAEKAGLENAAVQSVVGSIPVGEIIKPLTAGFNGLTGLAVRTGANVVGDASLGAAMQTGSNLVAKQNYDPNRAWYEQVPQSAAMMAAGGLAIHGTHEVLSAFGPKLRPPEAPPGEPFDLSQGRALPAPGGPRGPASPADMPATDAIRAYAGKGPVTAEPVENIDTPEGKAAAETAQALNIAPVEEGASVLFNTDHGPVHGVVEDTLPPPADGAQPDLVVKTPAGRARVPRDQAVPLPGDYEAARVATGAPLEQMPQAIADTQELRQAAPKGYSLFNAIRDLGGIKTREADGTPNDVAAIIDKSKPQPGVVNNKTGLSPDGMREALKERGWFGAVDESGANAKDSVAAPGTYLEDLHELIRQEVSGKDNRVFHPEAREQEARRGDLEDQMQQAGVGLETPLPEAAAKLAAWRGQQVRAQTTDMAILRTRAQELGVKIRDDATYDEALADVVEREAIQGEASPADADHYENLIDAELTAEEHEWLASGATGPVGEPGPAEPAEGAGEGVEVPAEVGGGEPGAGAGGGGENAPEAGAALGDALGSPELLARVGARNKLIAQARRETVEKFAIAAKHRNNPSAWSRNAEDFYRDLKQRLYDENGFGEGAPADAWKEVPTETQNIGGETVEQSLIPGAERSALQAAAAREGGLKPKVDQKAPGDLFAAPEPEAGDLFGRDQWEEAEAPAPRDTAASPEAKEAQAREETPPGTGYGEKNRVFSKEAADAARAKLNELRNRLNSGIDPDMVHAGITLAGYHVEAGARKFGDFAHAMIRDLGEWSAPWLRMWYNALRDYPGFDNAGMTPHDKLSDAAIDEAISNVRNSGPDLEQGGDGAAAPDANGPGALPPGSAGAERGPGSEGTGPAEAGVGAEGGDGLPLGSPPSLGEGRPGGLFEDPSWPERRAPQPGEPGGGGGPSDPGVQPDRLSAADLDRVADESAHLEPVAAGAHPYAESTDAPPVSHELEEALPTLFPEQRSDVAFAEDRFAADEGHGVMFTNGTGTGKTFVAGGLAKRFHDAGKTDILIVAPTQGILNAHVEAAKTLGYPLKILEGIDDNGGHGPVATTFANLAANTALAVRKWDLVIPDEAHTLSSDQEGSETEALKNFRAITNHPDRLLRKAEMQHPKDVARVDALRKQIPKGVMSGPAWDHWLEARRALDEKLRARAEELKAEPRSKVAFMSATPFAYDKSIDYANGYLFDYGPEPGGRGYNQPSAQQAFMIRHFGYSMRTGKLTRPDAAVVSDVLERQFHEWLRRQRALSARVLTVDKDYDRKFALIDDAVGNKIDQALEFLQNADEGKFSPFAEVVRKRFGYLERARLLEAIRAKHAIPRIAQHLALGRKVVVFHNYNEGGGFNPFRDLETVHFLDEEPGYSKALYQEFIARNPYVSELEEGFQGLPSPLSQLKAAYPEALVYNGTIPKKAREQAKQLFNQDGGPHNIIIVQSEAGQAGISLHDTTGMHQRAIENLGMPGRPTAAIQQEGRIYRIGQASDAIFRYLTTGTNWERHAFASTIAQRAGTAENLAMGDQARTMRESFINAYLDAAPNQPARGEGVGGKKADFDLAKAMTDFQKAKSFYFAEGKKAGRRDQREGKDYFATPEPLGLKMVEWADIRPGDKVLEPSAGHGAIARFLPETAERTLIEPSAHLASRAALSSPGAHVLEHGFEDLHAVNKYHAIVMNPPFGAGGSTAVDHIAKAANHLADGGRIVALIPRGPAADARFEKFIEGPAAKHLYQVASVDLPAVTFERAGTKASTRIVILDKHMSPDDALAAGRSHSYDSAETIAELFDRIEHAEMKARTLPAGAENPGEIRQEPAKSAAEARRDEQILGAGNRSFDTAEVTHGKTGLPVYVATAKDRMVTDEYKAVLALAKEHGGFYSSFRGKGAVPGFQFKSAGDRAAFMEAATSTEGGKFSAPPIFYSAVEKYVADSPTKAAPADQWKAMLKNAPGIKQEELQWTGVGDWLDLFPNGEKVPKEKLQAFLRENGVHVDEVVNGGVQPSQVAPDEQALADHRDEWDRIIAAKRAAEAERESADRATSYAAGQRINYLDGELGVLHGRMVQETMERAGQDFDAPETQYADWKLPGGKNYRELLLTLPKEAVPPATHWETPGVMAHVRFDEREAPDGKKVLFVEEIQSDWHQKGRDQGYAKASDAEQLAMAQEKHAAAVTAYHDASVDLVKLADRAHAEAGNAAAKAGLRRPPEPDWRTLPQVRFGESEAIPEEMANFAADWAKRAAAADYRLIPTSTRAQLDSATHAHDMAQLRFRETSNALHQAEGHGGIPDAPFKSTWPNLVMKRVIRWAVDNGFERVAWTTGEQQAERYDLGRRATAVTLRDNSSGGIGRPSMEGPFEHGSVVLHGLNGNEVLERHVRGEDELKEMVGAELARRLLEAEPTEGRHAGFGVRERRVNDLNQVVGGEGMKAFYDRNLVNITNDLIKKHGGKVDRGQVIATGGAHGEGPEGLKAWEEWIAARNEEAGLPRDADLDAVFRKRVVLADRLTEIEDAYKARDHAGDKRLGITLAKQHELTAALSEVRQQLRDLNRIADAMHSREAVTPEVHGFDITPELAKHVSGGQPLFKRGGEADVSRAPSQTESRVLLPGQPRGLEIRRYDNPTQAQTALIDKVEAVVRQIAPFADIHAASRMEASGEDTDGISGQVLGWAHRAGLRHLLAWSMEAKSPTGSARHEAVHVLKEAGLFHPDEWAALTRAAMDGDWLGAFNIEHRYRDLNIPGQIEEAIADKFAEWEANGKRGLSGPVGDAFKRIAQVLAHLRDLTRQFLGKNPDFKDVFSRMERGEVGSRFGEDIRDTTDRPGSFSVPGEPPEPKRVARLFNNLLGRDTDAVGRKLARAAQKAVPDPLLDIADQIKMGASPMGSGSTRAQAAAKDFANELRTSAYQWGKVDEWLNANFTRDSQQAMWEAADEHGVLIRRGVEPGPNEGKNRLSPKERAAVDNLQERADAAFEQAKNLDMVRGDGLESYVPRMVVEMTAGGPRIVSSAGRRAARKGANLSTTTGQLRQRKYETVEETEEAAREHFGEKATVVRNIRTLALATQRLERAIAGRVLVDKIKAMSKDAQAALVVDGARPDTSAFFTLEHPALQRWGPKFIRDEATGKVTAATDQNGDTIFEARPLWVAREFEGPLKAVLTSPSNGLYRAVMDLKGKMMSVIMYSPLMHNAVIWGKAIPADPRGVLTFQAYRRGSVAKADPAVMEEAMRAGLDPIGRRFFNQDVTSIAEGAQIVPGRSWTSQILAYVPGLLDPKAGEAVKAAIDKAGDVWHNTFLWDRVGDLQMGLYVHIRDQLLQKSNETGIGRRDAQRIAAHFANRYAGSLPLESMSALSRGIANVMLFSRSFTLGNLAAYKDIVKGLPSDVRAQVLRDSGAEALERVQGVGRQKAIGMLVLDVALSYVGLFMAAAATAWLTGQHFQAPWDNEKDREKRFLIGYQPDGTAIYGRLPTGKVGEELQDWLTEPRDILLRKLSPYGKLMYGLAANDKGFGRKIYQPDDPLAKNAARVAWFAFQGIAPVGQLQGMKDMVTGAQDRKTAALQALAPIAGVTISKGAPGGPAMSDFYRAKEAHDFAVQEALPDIKRQIKTGDLVGARAKMKALGIAPGLQAFYIRTARAPGTRLTGRALRDFNAYASPEEKAQLAKDRAATIARQQEETTP